VAVAAFEAELVAAAVAVAIVVARSPPVVAVADVPAAEVVPVAALQESQDALVPAAVPVAILRPPCWGPWTQNGVPPSPILGTKLGAAEVVLDPKVAAVPLVAVAVAVAAVPLVAVAVAVLGAVVHVPVVVLAVLGPVVWAVASAPAVLELLALAMAAAVVALVVALTLAVVLAVVVAPEPGRELVSSSNASMQAERAKPFVEP